MGNYSKNNLIWATPEWERVYDGVPVSQYIDQIYNGWSLEDVLDSGLGPLIAFDGGELPEVTVNYSDHPATGIIKTWYPGNPNAYGFTGHSEVIYPRGGSKFKATAHMDDEGYNLVTNNCSDLALLPLLRATGQEEDSWFFNTPGDTRDWIKKRFKTIQTVNKPTYEEHEFEIPLDVLQNLNKYFYSDQYYKDFKPDLYRKHQDTRNKIIKRMGKAEYERNRNAESDIDAKPAD